MRTTFRKNGRIASLLAVCTLAACSDAATLPQRTITLDETDLKSLIVAQGYRADMIQDFGDYYLVEGDISFSKNELRQKAGRGPSYQYTTHNLVSPANIWQIRVDLSGLANEPAWQNAARQALAAWSSVSGSHVRMSEGSPANIVFVAECRGDGVLGRVDVFPSNGAPSPTVYVNTCWKVNGVYTTPSDPARMHTTVHELGHAIGFRHSNWNQNDCRDPFGQPISCNWDPGVNGANHVANTPTSGNDPASVMNGGVAGTAWAGFSTHDAYATRVRYPLPAPVATVTNSGGYPLISWGALPGATSYGVELVEFIRVTSHTEPSWSDETVTYLGSTTGTSLLDSANPYTGKAYCMRRWSDGTTRTDRWDYIVTASFTTGSTRVTVPAPVATRC